MKKILLAVLVVFPIKLFAHCPSKIEKNGEAYCASLSWGLAEVKLKGEFIETTKLSPVRVPARTAPPKWIYSKATINVWKNGDKTHSPVFLEGLRFFPYMTMISGHHHGVAYDMELDDEGYVLSKMPLHEMPGCWSVRWTFNGEDSIKRSSLLLKVMSYQNLSDNSLESESVLSFCMSDEGSVDGGGKVHHDH